MSPDREWLPGERFYCARYFDFSEYVNRASFRSLSYGAQLQYAQMEQCFIQLFESAKADVCFVQHDFED